MGLDEISQHFACVLAPPERTKGSPTRSGVVVSVLAAIRDRKYGADPDPHAPDQALAWSIRGRGPPRRQSNPEERPNAC